MEEYPFRLKEWPAPYDAVDVPFQQPAQPTCAPRVHTESTATDWDSSSQMQWHTQTQTKQDRPHFPTFCLKFRFDLKINSVRAKGKAERTERRKEPEDVIRRHFSGSGEHARSHAQLQ